MKILTHPDYPGQIVEESDPERITHMVTQGGWVEEEAPLPEPPPEPPPPVRKVWQTGGHLWAEFSDPERVAIAASGVPEIKALVLALAFWPDQVFSDDPRVQSGFAALVATGLVSQQRADQILNPPGFLTTP